jgi:hypothetical protein
MNHLGDIAPILTALGFLLNASVALMSYLQSRRNGKEQASIKRDMGELALNTNSIRDALVASTAKASLAEGTAVGLEQGRNERR